MSINISDHTKQYIILKQELNDFYNHIYDVMVGTFSSNDNQQCINSMNDMFNKHFAEHLFNIEKDIDEYLIDSINDDLSEANNRY